MPDSCFVSDCVVPAFECGLCWSHFRQYQQTRQVDPHMTLTSFIDRMNKREPEPVVCICEEPRPDAIGMCQECGRKVVTFALANRDRYRERYPMEWERAVQLSLFPEVAPDYVLTPK